MSAAGMNGFKKFKNFIKSPGRLAWVFWAALAASEKTAKSARQSFFIEAPEGVERPLARSGRKTLS